MLELLKTGRNVLFIDVDIAVVRADLVEHVMSKYVAPSSSVNACVSVNIAHLVLRSLFQ